jgi:epoxyqueuosine reductase
MIRSIVEKHLVPKEEFVFGFADLNGLLPDKYANFRYGISIGKKLNDSIIDNLNDGPTLEYFNHYKDINRQLAELTLKISYDLEAANIISKPIDPTISVSSNDNEKYLKTLSYDISHKMVATRAGLGWIGKTDLLITKEFGPRLRLVSILVEQDPGCNQKPIEKSKCGKCDICVLECPAQAANGLEWNVKIHRDNFFNAFKCREKCMELAKQKLKVDERICGKCIRSCPLGSS